MASESGESGAPEGFCTAYGTIDYGQKSKCSAYKIEHGILCVVCVCLKSDQRHNTQGDCTLAQGAQEAPVSGWVRLNVGSRLLEELRQMSWMDFGASTCIEARRRLLAQHDFYMRKSVAGRRNWAPSEAGAQ